MDNLTHTLTGLMLSRAGLRQFTPHAGALLMLSANAPDLDTVSLLWGADVYLEYHRWWTHAIAAIPLVAALPVAVVAAVARARLPWLKAWAVCILGVSSHLLLDWTNHYGVRLFSPFSDAWQSLGIAAVIDGWIWAMLLLAVLAPVLSRLVSAEMGAKRTTGQGWAVAALAFLLLYDGARYALRTRAITLQTSRVYRGVAPARVTALPDPLNPLLWTGLVETSEFYVRQPVRLQQGFDSSGQEFIYKPERTQAQEVARQTPVFRRFLAFSEFPLFRAVPASEPEGGTLVEAMDLRFGAPPQERFVASALLDRSLRVERTWFRF